MRRVVSTQLNIQVYVAQATVGDILFLGIVAQIRDASSAASPS